MSKQPTLQFISGAITRWYRRPFWVITILVLAAVTGGWLLSRWGEGTLRRRLAAGDGAPPVAFATARFRLFPPRVVLSGVRVESAGSESLAVDRALAQFTWRSLLRRGGLPSATLLHLDGVRWMRSAAPGSASVTNLRRFLARAGVPSIETLLLTQGVVLDARGTPWLAAVTLRADRSAVRLQGQLFQEGDLNARITPGIPPTAQGSDRNFNIVFNAERLALPRRQSKGTVTGSFGINRDAGCAVSGTFQTAGELVAPLDHVPLHELADRLGPNVEVQLASASSAGDLATRAAGPIGLTGRCKGGYAPVENVILSYLSRIILGGLVHTASPAYVQEVPEEYREAIDN